MSAAVQRGALIIEKVEDQKDDGTLQYPITIEFQFNPESLRRTIKRIFLQQENVWQYGEQENRSADPRDLGTDSYLGESISITAWFDGKEEYFSGDLIPVVSVIEKLMEPVETTLSDTSSAHVNPPKVLPLVFFWWGQNRILPVKIIELTINETEFTPDLQPIRVEVNMELEVLIPWEGGDPKIANSYAYVARKRNEGALKFSQNASQASKSGYSEAKGGG